MSKAAIPDILRICKSLGWKISLAESCTGGLLGAAITEVPGASEVFDRGFITYSNQAKMEMLGVASELLAEHGAVSEPVALAMATGAAEKSGADLALAITGIAGPGGSENKPEGLVCFALYQRGQPAQVISRNFGAIGREKVRKSSVRTALTLLMNTLRTAGGEDYDASA